MADSKKMSVEEVLAACRRMDSADKGASAAPETHVDAAPPTPAAAAAPAPSAEQPQTAAAEPAAKAAAAGPTKKPAEMSVADMLAAARAEKSQPAPAAEQAPAAGQAPAKPAAAAKKPSQMSVADMLAAARAEKSGAPAAKPAAPAKPAAEKPAAAAPAAKAAAPKPKETAKAGGPKDTTSILAAARGTAKPGPMSKAEAAAAKAQAAAPAKKTAAAVVVPPMPARPAYLEPQPAAAPSTRRSFFGAMAAVVFGSSLALGFSSLFVTNLLWLLGFARFMFPNILTEPPTVFKVGFPGDYAPGQVETKYVAAYGVWVVRYEYNGQPQIYALRTVCTHLGCTPNWLEAEQKFKCPCHGSGFYKDGINFEGPAPRPLERHVIRLADDGQLEVDKSRKFQEEVGQWKDPASFVPV